MKKIPQILIIISLLSFVSVHAEVSTERPPQYVLLAFDNCQENETWEGVSKFLDEMNKIKNGTLRFTFFVSGAALLSDGASNNYKNPSFLATESQAAMKDPENSLFPERAARLKRGRVFSIFGKSNIGFGGSPEELKERIVHINQLYQRGNEIASHAVGHFNASKWTQEMWAHEMNEFNNIIDNIGLLNQDSELKLDFKAKDILGFRAPYLEGNESLINTLSLLNYKYDTSDTNQGEEPTTWPKYYATKSSSKIWNFGLGFITVFGNPKLKIPAMDYNFCFRQGNGCPETYPDTMKSADVDGRNMLLSYLKYFTNNYNGNRAPIHIGHHFYKYRGGIYNKALFEFARIVCSEPEVKCVTYKDLAAFMDSKTEAQLNSYQKGLFTKSDYSPSLDELALKIQW